MLKKCLLLGGGLPAGAELFKVTMGYYDYFHWVGFSAGMGSIRPQTFLGKKITFLFSGETATEVHVDSIVDVGNIRIKRLDTGSSVLLVKKTLGNTTYWQGYQLLFTQSDVGKTIPILLIPE